VNKQELQKLPGFPEFLSLYKSSNTQACYSGDCKDFFDHVEKDPKEVTKIDVIRYMNSLKDKMSDRSVCRKMISVRQYFNFLVSIEEIQKNPLVGPEMKLPKFIVDSTSRKYLSDEDLTRIFSYLNKRIKDTKNEPKKNARACMGKAVISLMVYNGLRRHEVAGLNFGSIFDMGDTKVIKVLGKGNKERTRPIHPEAYSAVVSYLKSTNRLNGNESDPIFIVRSLMFPGNPKFKKVNETVMKRITGGKIWLIVRSIAKRAKVKGHVSPHAFRAKFASMALEAGVPITSVQFDLGHSSIETTSIYDRAKSALDRSSVHKIPSFSKE
jgi:integrase/recombinase XerC